MNKETTTVLQCTVVLDADRPAVVYHRQSLAITIIGASTSEPQPRAAKAAPEHAGEHATVAEPFILPSESMAPAWRDPRTLRGELLVHLTVGIILMTVATVTAHFAPNWH